MEASFDCARLVQVFLHQPGEDLELGQSRIALIGRLSLEWLAGCSLVFTLHNPPVVSLATFVISGVELFGSCHQVSGCRMTNRRRTLLPVALSPGKSQIDAVNECGLVMVACARGL
jgi:hypothetical protein